MSPLQTRINLLAPKSAVEGRHQYHFLVIVDQESARTTLYIQVSCTTMVESCTPLSWQAMCYVICSWS